MTPTTYLREAFKFTFRDWFGNYETPPVYITSIEEIDRRRVHIVLIDEVDVFMFQNPSGLHSLTTDFIPFVGFSASIMFATDG